MSYKTFLVIHTMDTQTSGRPLSPKLGALYQTLCYSHTQPGHEPDLMRVKMWRNSPGIDRNLHTVRVETAKYSFCIRI
jgi:hypothetical protein